MNIFVLDTDPKVAAQALCDKHVPKMVLETAQLLCSPYEPGSMPYKRTHYNHPCAIWTRASYSNMLWLIEYGLELADEYSLRFGREHKSREVIERVDSVSRAARLPDRGLTPFAQAMPDEYKGPDAVEAYRAYYRGSKVRFAKWAKGRPQPAWF